MTQADRERLAKLLTPALDEVLVALASSDARLRPHVQVVPSAVYDFSILGWLTWDVGDDEELVISVNKFLNRPNWSADIVDNKSQAVAQAEWTDGIQLRMSARAEIAQSQIAQFLTDAMADMRGVLERQQTTRSQD